MGGTPLENKTPEGTFPPPGNIATYAAPGKATVTYTYDKQGQLLSASNGYSYTYDNVGNILTATKNGTTHTYTYSTYDWKDKLISYDGQAIAYDASGNPTSYYNGTRWNMTWENGRELATASSGNTSLAFTYNGDGIRTSKTVNGVEHKYYYSGGKLLRETYGSNILDFAYNADGTLYSLRINGTYYYYVTNLQGDVISIVDAEGEEVASYEYDPYGGIAEKSGTLADINPLRYRGYYYDTDTNLYYLQSRYYDPELGRFINADAFTSTGQGLLGNNMFAYCGNNPACHADFLGRRHMLCTAQDFGGKRNSEFPYTTVSNEKVDIYIVEYGSGENMANSIGDTGNAYVIEDMRDSPNPSNPNMKIYYSYLVSDSQTQREILAVIVDYNKLYPSKQIWSREIDEMQNEWQYHNALASVGFNLGRTGHVDLDMNDKNKTALQKGIEFIWQKIS